MQKFVPTNIKIKFDKAIVILPTHDSRITTREGVELWLKPKPGSEYQPMASIPDGTLDQYKHCRPQILSCDWQEAG
jgi:hypothetical protein